MGPSLGPAEVVPACVHHMQYGPLCLPLCQHDRCRLVFV